MTPGGVRLSRFAPADRRASGPTLLYSGVLTEPRKRVGDLLEALALVARDEPSVRLWLSGPGDPSPLLAAAPREARERTEVLPLGTPDMAHVYGQAWATVLPSVYEAFGLALVEACNAIEVDGLRFMLEHTRRGEAVLRVEGGADDRVTDSDAFFRDRHPVLRPLPLVPEAERTARAAERWTRTVIDRLRGERFNVITLKWWGRPRPVPTFEQRHGAWIVVDGHPERRGDGIGGDVVVRRPDTSRCEQVGVALPQRIDRRDDGLARVIRPGLRRHAASVVTSAQAPGASGPVEIWRSVEITVTSGQYFACSSANSR